MTVSVDCDACCGYQFSRSPICPGSTASDPFILHVYPLRHGLVSSHTTIGWTSQQESTWLPCSHGMFISLLFNLYCSRPQAAFLVGMSGSVFGFESFPLMLSLPFALLIWGCVSSHIPWVDSSIVRQNNIVCCSIVYLDFPHAWHHHRFDCISDVVRHSCSSDLAPTGCKRYSRWVLRVVLDHKITHSSSVV
jgi:hypothetical protein